MSFKGTNGTLDMFHDLVNSLDSLLHFDSKCVLNKEVRHTPLEQALLQAER